MRGDIKDRDGLVHHRFGDDLCECVCIRNHPDNAPICGHGAQPLTTVVAWPICGPCNEAISNRA